MKKRYLILCLVLLSACVSSGEKAETIVQNRKIPEWYNNVPPAAKGKIFFAGFSGDCPSEKSAIEEAVKDAEIQAAKYHATYIKRLVDATEIVQMIEGDVKLKGTLNARTRIYAEAVMKKTQVRERQLLVTERGAHHGYVLVEIEESSISPSTKAFQEELRKKTAIVLFIKNDTLPEIKSNLRFVVTEGINSEMRVYALSEMDIGPVLKSFKVDPDSLNTSKEAIQIGKLFVTEYVVIGDVRKIGKLYYAVFRLIDLWTEKTMAEQKINVETEDQLYEQAPLAAASLFATL